MYKQIIALVICTICGGAQASIGSWIEPNLGQTDAAVRAICGSSNRVIDGSDNCLDVANPSQRDTDNDAYGNFCDPDLNNDGVANFSDLQLFKQRFFGTDPDADLDGDGMVNFVDLQIAKGFIFGPPGPSGLLLP